jgi:hypothetical protein
MDKNVDKTEEMNRVLTAKKVETTIEGTLMVDPEGNIKCLRCAWTHTTTECAEYRLANAQRELEKITKFVHMSIGTGYEGESPVDTFIRGYQRLYASWQSARAARGESTEVTDLMKEE